MHYIYIYSRSSSHNIAHKWSPVDAFGTIPSITACISHHTNHVLDPSTLSRDGWIVDISAKRVSKLPQNIPVLSVTASATSNTSLVFATNRGAVIVMHFNQDGPETGTL